MFERFTDTARRVVVLAQEEARQRRADRVTPEHLLLGIPGCPGTPGAEFLREAGVGTAEVERGLTGSEPYDPEALAALGIDLHQVRRAAEAAFGPGALERRRGRWTGGHIRFDPASKKVLELALMEAVRLSDRHIGTEHLLLGLLHPGHSVARLLEDHGLSLAGTRLVLERRRGRRAG